MLQHKRNNISLKLKLISSISDSYSDYLNVINNTKYTKFQKAWIQIYFLSIIENDISYGYYKINHNMFESYILKNHYPSNALNIETILYDIINDNYIFEYSCLFLKFFHIFFKKNNTYYYLNDKTKSFLINKMCTATTSIKYIFIKELFILNKHKDILYSLISPDCFYLKLPDNSYVIHKSIECGIFLQEWINSIEINKRSLDNSTILHYLNDGLLNNEKTFQLFQQKIINHIHTDVNNIDILYSSNKEGVSIVEKMVKTNNFITVLLLIHCGYNISKDIKKYILMQIVDNSIKQFECNNLNLIQSIWRKTLQTEILCKKISLLNRLNNKSHFAKKYLKNKI